MKFNFSELDERLKERLLSSANILGLTECSCAMKLIGKKSDRAYFECSENALTIYYKKGYEFFYGLKKFLSSPDVKSADIKCSFSELGVMLDCSRNAVRTVKTVKTFIDYLAFMGYNQLQLYTEDTYEIEGEPYFGYQRGRYTADEIREIDEYAKGYDIELVPNVQTLGHLNQIFRWKRFKEINDIDSVLLIGDERTYDFIDRMFASLAKTFTSRKLHIGLDEAHNIGRGKYLDNNGYRDSATVMCEHISCVVEIARKHGFEPMMWADMFFRLANNGTYYVTEDAPPISEEVIKMIPDGLRLVYWDYYQDNQKAYENMMDRCKAFNKEVVFAGGAWCWRGFAPANKFSDMATMHAFNACKAKGIQNVFLTMWGDNGAECSPFSTLSALSYASDYAYGEENHESSFFALTGIRKADFLLLDSVNDIRSDKPSADCIGKIALYNDAFLGLFDYFMKEDDSEKYKAIAEKLKAAKATAGRLEYIFETLYRLAKVLEYKAPLGVKTRKLYQLGDKKALKKLAKSEYSKTVCRLESFYEAFKEQWYRESKGFGFEVQAARIGGLIKRVSDCKELLLDYVAGKVDSIPELECEPLSPVEDEGDVLMADIANNYRIIATTAVT